MSTSTPRGSAPGLELRALGWWLALLAVAFAAGLWTGRRELDRSSQTSPGETSATGQSGAAPAEERPAATEAAPLDPDLPNELRSELRQALWELESQQRRVEELQADLAAARADAERNRRGLEEAVGELNRLTADVERLRRATSRRGAATQQQPPRPRVRPRGAPTVTVSPMGFVVASGQVDNPHYAAARGTLEVSLMGSAGVIETRELLMDIPPRSSERYDLTFTNIFPTERLGATARWRE